MPDSSPVDPSQDTSMDARAMQKRSAAALRGTKTAQERAAKAGSSVSPEAAQERARKAAAARWGKKATP